MEQWNAPKNGKAQDITAAAYKIVNQLQAPDLMGDCDVSDKDKAIACNIVLEHWHKYANGAMIPGDLREIIDHWVGKHKEFWPQS
jgi:hypothetical protein